MLPWNITVISDDPQRASSYLGGGYADSPIKWFNEVKNALLYGSSVSWLPLDRYRTELQMMVYRGSRHFRAESDDK